MTFSLLRILADGETRSEEGLARLLGGDAGAIGRHLQSIRALGLEVVHDGDACCRLAVPLDLIQPEELRARLAGGSSPFAVEVVDECESTSTLLSGRAVGGAPHGSVIIAEHQSAGRGRRGNAWRSSIGASLVFSLLWRFDRPASALDGLSLAAAVALARGLADAGVPAVQVKWPNDLLLGGRKLGGILLEASGVSDGPGTVVIGVGINLRIPPSLAGSLPQAADLCAFGPPRRTTLAAALLRRLGEGLDDFARCGFAAFRGEWEARHAWQGQQVSLRADEIEIASGTVVGVDEGGALLLRSAEGVRRFHSGELSLRSA